MGRDKAHQAEYNRQYYQKRKAELQERHRQWVQNNPEKNRENVARHREKSCQTYDEKKPPVDLSAKLDEISEKLQKEE